MKKNILMLIYIFFISSNVHAQIDCGTDACVQKMESTKSSGDIPLSYQFIPAANDPIKTIRVNFHFILRDSGHQDYPGNYTMTDDGNGNTSYTGYDFAEELLESANSRLASKPQMNLPPDNTTSALDKKYKYLLSGVFFHENNSYYVYSENPITINTYFDINASDCINLFFQGENTSYSSGGVAHFTGNRGVAFNGVWDKGKSIYVNAGLLNHEIGHNLSLRHTLIPNDKNGLNGNCNGEDYCDDTPTSNELYTSHGIEPCDSCERWLDSDPNCPNNRMGYNGYSAMTPDQLGRVHWTIENEIESTKSCYFTTMSSNITGFSDNELVVAETVTIPSTADILIEDNNALYISTESFVIEGTLEIEYNSQLTVYTESDCN